MTVTPLQEFLSAALARQSTANVSRPVAAASVSTASSASGAAGSGAASSVSVPPQGVTNLHNASVTLAQLGSMLEVAQGGIETAQSVLQNLQELASQAAAGGPPEALAQLNSEFQQVLSQLNTISSSTRFDGTSLLNGSLANSQATANTNTQNTDSPLSSLSLPDVGVQGLFGANPPDISNVADANAALDALGNAQTVVDSSAAATSSVQAQVSLAGAGVESAIANTTAASSVLNDSDFTGADATAADSLAALQDSPAASAGMQGNNLPANIMSLLQG